MAMTSTEEPSLESNSDYDKESRLFFEKWLTQENTYRPEDDHDERDRSPVYSGLPYDWYVNWCEKTGVPSSGVDLSNLMRGLEIIPSVGDSWSPSFVASSVITNFCVLAEGMPPREAEARIYDFLLLESRLDAAATDEQRRQILDTISLLKRSLLKRLESFKNYRFTQGKDQFFIDFARQISRFPIRYRGVLYVNLHFREENFRILVTISPHSPHENVIDAVCQKLEGTAVHPQISRERVEQVVVECLGAGPPYEQLWLLSDSSRDDPPSAISLAKWHANIDVFTELHRIINQKNDWAGNLREIEPTNSEPELDSRGSSTPPPSSLPEPTASPSSHSSSSHSDHQTAEDKKMCLDCLRIRKEVQEDLLAALSQASKNLDAENNAIMREIFNPL